jgi:hypothetical protein
VVHVHPISLKDPGLWGPARKPNAAPRPRADENRGGLVVVANMAQATGTRKGAAESIVNCLRVRRLILPTCASTTSRRSWIAQGEHEG